LWVADYENSGATCLFLTLYFDGAGNFHGTAVVNAGGTVSNIAVMGTYTVGANGALTVSASGGSPFTGGVSADGNTLVFTSLNSGDSPDIDVGVRM